VRLEYAAGYLNVKAYGSFTLPGELSRCEKSPTLPKGGCYFSLFAIQLILFPHTKVIFFLVLITQLFVFFCVRLAFQSSGTAAFF